MGRKSQQAGGNMPLTHYERTKKFASSEYGTTSQRLAGHSQYQLGDCALSITRIEGDAALCTPSGYLYSEQAILEYLLTKTQEIKEQQEAYQKQQSAADVKARMESEGSQKRMVEFQEAQKVIKKRKANDEKQSAQNDLKRVSYWLAGSQPDAVEPQQVPEPPERPQSPHSQQPLKRKDIWPVRLQWDENKLVCAVSHKTIQAQQAIAFWTDKKVPGTIILETVYKDLKIDKNQKCPNTGKRIKHTRLLQKSGSSFAASGQNVEVKKYRPTIT